MTTKDLSKDLAKEVSGQAASGILGTLTGAGFSPDPTAVVHITLDVARLAWKAGAYLSHRSTVQKQLAACLEEYREAGLLEAASVTEDSKPTVWRTTRSFRDKRWLLSLYPDIGRYINDKAITGAELEGLGLDGSPVSLFEDQSAVKGLGNITQRLSACCVREGIRDITKTDAEKRIANVSFMHIGAVALQNAFIAEGQRREAGKQAEVVPVLGRVLDLVTVCGINAISIADITTVLGKAPMFETVARARIAKLRDQHASEVINCLLFGGNTQSTARGFATLASQFKGDRALVGRVTRLKKSQFLSEYADCHCELRGPHEKNVVAGAPIYMMAGWANLIKQREAPEKQHSMLAQMVHLHGPTKFADIHGNVYMSGGKMGKIVFKVKALPDGTLMAKPRNFDKFDYKSKADYNKGHNRFEATGEEKLFGGIVGPPMCGCRGVADPPKKGQMIKNWKLGQGLTISSYDFVGNSIEHTREMTTKKIAVLWRPGDWAMGAFFMQVLPQSSYLQGRGQCLYCAVERAALAGCPEVIACGGGTVSERAVAEEREREREREGRALEEEQRPLWDQAAEKQTVAAPPLTPPTSSPIKRKPAPFPPSISFPATPPTTPPTAIPDPPLPLLNRLSSSGSPSIPPQSPPLPYGGWSPTAGPVEYFAISNAADDKVIPFPPPPPPPMRIARKPVGGGVRASTDYGPALSSHAPAPAGGGGGGGGGAKLPFLRVTAEQQEEEKEENLLPHWMEWTD